MAEQKQDDQIEHTYSSYVRIRDSPEDLPEAMNDREKWRERVRISVLAARHDNNDDDYIYISIYIYIYIYSYIYMCVGVCV